MMAERMHYNQPMVSWLEWNDLAFVNVNAHHFAHLTSWQPQTAAGYTDETGEDWPPLPDTVYTNQAPPVTHNANGCKVPYNGWSNKGLVEFNRICKKLKAERETFPLFDTHYSDWAAQFCKPRASKRKRHAVIASTMNWMAATQPPLEDW
jgi:hypothetical protein